MILPSQLFDNLIRHHIVWSRPSTTGVSVHLSYLDIATEQIRAFLDKLHRIEDIILGKIIIGTVISTAPEMLEREGTALGQYRMRSLRTAIGQNIKDFSFAVLDTSGDDSAFSFVT